MEKELPSNIKSKYIQKTIMNQPRFMIVLLVVTISLIVAMLAMGTKGLTRETPLTVRMNPCVPLPQPPPDSVWDGRTFLVYAGKDFYRDNPAPECIYRGVLKRKDMIGLPINTFYLELDNGKLVRVWHLDTVDEVIQSFLDKRVEIRGKYVQKEDGERELRVGYISSVDSICPNPTSTPAPASNTLTFLVEADTDSYKNNPAPECTYHGVLEDATDAFYLKLDDDRRLSIPNSTSDMILGSLINGQIKIHGKYVQKEDGERELRVGHIVALECVLPPSSGFTPTPESKTFLVEADTDSYKNNPAPECTYHGVLLRNVIDEGDFYLELVNRYGVLDIQDSDTSDVIFDSLVNRRVEIRGKYVQKEDGERELRVRYITSK